MNPSPTTLIPDEGENNPLRADGAVARPVGVLEPDDPIARRVMVALGDGRIEDAEGHLRRMRGVASAEVAARDERSGVERSWTPILEGMVAEAKGRLGEAERWFRTVACADVEAPSRSVIANQDRSLAFTARTEAATVHEFDPRIDTRVRALALECLGRVLRRMDDPVGGDAAHRASLEIRERVGSWEECRKSAHELALDASVAGKHGDAIAWHQRALGFADAMDDGGLLLRAETLSHLARVDRDAGSLDAAIQHAQASADLRKRLDPSSLETVRAALELVECRVAHAAEFRSNGTSMASADATGREQSAPHPRSSDDGAPKATAPLDAVIVQLLELRGEFSAWGVGVEDELDRCDEALDFARRLRESSLLP